MKVYLVGAGRAIRDSSRSKAARSLSAPTRSFTITWQTNVWWIWRPRMPNEIYVGKKRSAHEFTQEEICAMLIERARRGWNVVRLKGGDPFIFGRGRGRDRALAAAGSRSKLCRA